MSKSELDFERVLEKATGLSGFSQSLDRKNGPKMAELEELTRKNRIQERLAALKTKAEK